MKKTPDVVKSYTRGSQVICELSNSKNLVLPFISADGSLNNPDWSMIAEYAANAIEFFYGERRIA